VHSLHALLVKGQEVFALDIFKLTLGRMIDKIASDQRERRSIKLSVMHWIVPVMSSPIPA
jgi:hypothetical protein